MLESEEYYFEAALVLKQQYDCIHWESEEVTFDNVFYKNYDGIGNEQLKEQLGKRIIDLLNQAKEYEYAAELCQELQGHYLNEYKYKELSPLLKQWASYLDLIMTEQRLMLNYYRVTFIGGTLPSYMKQHRDYIVKGSIWFKTITLTVMLQSAFPDAKIKAYQSSPPTESPTDQAMTIYLAKMEPVASDVEFTKNSKISIKIRSFYKDHKINCFFSDHPYHKGVIDKNNEVKSLHVSRIVVWTDMMMPNEFMWNPIIDEDREIFTPIDVAIDIVERKNTGIQEMINEIEENPLKDMRPFTMLLTGTLDAGVNGGMPKYIEAFFSESSNVLKDINVDRLNDFRNVLIEQKDVLTEALALHKKLAPPAILPMHERLEECFGYLKKSIIDLDVARKRSFSHMRNLGDIYAHIHELIVKGSSEMEDAFTPEREKVHIRDPTNPLFPNCNEDARISSSCSSPRRTQLSSASRSLCNSQSDIELDKSSLTTKHPILRKVSSTDEEMFDKMAMQYLTKQKSLMMTPALSSPDIRPLTMCLSVDESKTLPLKSPPLPPKDMPSFETNEDSVTTGQSKSMKSSIWKTLISRGKEVKSSNGKYTLEAKGKSKPHVADIF